MSIPRSSQMCNDLSMLERRLRSIVSRETLFLSRQDLEYIHALALRVSEEFHVKHVAEDGSDHIGNL
jgi:hypothetical protein